MELTSIETRVIGCLLEKEVTTPEQYPLSLNALTLACNQKSSRCPVMELTETDVQQAVDSLTQKRLISEQTGFGSRVAKYKHRFCNTEFSDLQFNQAQLAIVCLLMLRGPQTAGELRTRSNRLHDFKNIVEVEQQLTQMAQADPAQVKLLAKEPGKREAKYCQLFSEQSEQLLADESTYVSPSKTALEQRVTTLEQQVAELQSHINELLAR
ncbi:YceH family protein [Shewanella marina]|uniref:YceH family protein n=1 Tax=Shewanella marina TaxID=487319 RepID=UPI00046FF80B|nr:YceH family protein [Shewanella marina]